MNAKEIAQILKNEFNNAIKELSQKTFYRGVVSAKTGQVADVLIEGSENITPNITCIGSYQPAVDDVVMVVSIGTTGANMLCLGKIDGANAAQSKVTSVTTTATLNPATPICIITGQTTALSIAAPSFTPYAGQGLIVRLIDNGTARAISHTTAYQATMGTAFPTTTVINKWMYLAYMYNEVDSKWDLLQVTKEA